jgi:alpha-glucosidase
MLYPKNRYEVVYFDLEDAIILEDEFHWEESYEYGGNIVKMSKASKDGECFYGLSDKAHEFERKATGKFCDRSICFSKDQEPLYKVVPFI